MSATDLFQKRQRSDTSPDTPTAAKKGVWVRVELKTISKQYWVQPPDQDTRPSHLVPVSSRARAQDKIQKRAIQGAAKRALHVFNNAPLVWVDKTLEALLSKKKKNTAETLKNMRKLAEQQLGDKEPLAFTTIYVDVYTLDINGLMIRLEEEKYLTLETQYNGRTISDLKKGVEEGQKYVSDGIPENLLIPYKYTVQYLISQSPPMVPIDVCHPENLEELENYLF
ncbi:uncharacterized protein STEHIDRAFT_111364 [Stereum hirsutum FP-91666 SS1]|uniref:uncharacterized protein n=1 Tax=Stereum hirsutum (strain FP-91666) TaxID=721885 RepID=UPI000444A237|nr:uncharacterized protein STEHIDRAFT_111364 [Stereum hirsutum FP-91666 SS1]EIM86986.1 hypothetical protein STEHIDRAFT_111364 [Stereum hirsutum FP-91666 SS1]